MFIPFKGAIRLLLVPLMLFLLPACKNIPLPVGHGHIELDEKTDPRFAKPDQAGQIGILQARGDNVFLNQRPVSGKQRIMNGDSVRTGRNSRASVHFTGIFSDKCPQGIRIEEFMKGRLLGRTQTCHHHLITSNGRFSTEEDRTEYHVQTFPDFTELTIIKGSASISTLQDVNMRIRVSGGHEVRLEGSRIIGPRRLSPGEINERIKWTRTNVPELIGLNLREADLELKRFGLKRGAVIPIESNDHQMIGRIAKQEPPPGSRVEYDTAVKLWFWTEAVQSIRLPNLIGRSAEEAEKILAGKGLRVGSISMQKNDGKHQPGQVQRQSPKAGSKVAAGSSVDLWIWGNTQILDTKQLQTPTIRQRQVPVIEQQQVPVIK
jgi:hypothetical protein